MDCNCRSAKKPLHVGQGGKVSLDNICSDGFDMIRDNFSARIYSATGELFFPKASMRQKPDKTFVFTFIAGSGNLGLGDYYLEVRAFVPDDDFPNGIREEIDKKWLCEVVA